jgi:hypothetical protein
MIDMFKDFKEELKVMDENHDDTLDLGDTNDRIDFNAPL